MRRFAFPLPLGSTVPAIVEPPSEPPFWTNVTHSSLQWIAHSQGQIPRFEHVFPQESGSDQQFVRDTDEPFGTPD